MEKENSDELNSISSEELKLIILTHSALAGASVASVVQISTREQINQLLLVALACFAIALPVSLLVVLLLNYRLLERLRLGEAEKRIQYWPGTRSVQLLRYITYVTSFGGFVLMFWSFHAGLGLIFLITSLIAFAIALYAESHKSKQARKIKERLN